MNLEWVSYGIAIVILALIIGALLYRMSGTARREDAHILMRLKTEFFPQLEANLSEILGKLEREDTNEYVSLVMRGLGATLKLEFSLRFEDRVRRLEQLRDDLGTYEKELVTLSAALRDDALAAGVKLHNSRLRETVNDLLWNVRELSKLEKLPGKLPVAGH